MGNKLNKYDKKHVSAIALASKRIDVLYADCAEEMARLGLHSGFDAENAVIPFSFNKYPTLKKKANALIKALSAGITAEIIDGISGSFELSRDKNTDYIMELIKDSNVPEDILPKLLPRTTEALRAYQSSRKIDGMSLSDKVWNIAETAKSDFELAIDIGITDGRSASELSRDIRSYLANPDKLFRRVHDKYGNLQLSRSAANYRPGQGVYRSSYKNALRMTRTEINMAYRKADSEAWKNNPLVVGFEIRLSNNHPVEDICDDLKGRYPKDFVFMGWHPACRCYAVPISPNTEEFNKYIDGLLNGDGVNDFNFSDEIENPPKGFNTWIGLNEGRIRKMEQNGTTPQWIKDNKKYM